MNPRDSDMPLVVVLAILGVWLLVASMFHGCVWLFQQAGSL